LEECPVLPQCDVFRRLLWRAGKTASGTHHTVLSQSRLAGLSGRMSVRPLVLTPLLPISRLDSLGLACPFLVLRHDTYWDENGSRVRITGMFHPNIVSSEYHLFSGTSATPDVRSSGCARMLIPSSPVARRRPLTAALRHIVLGFHFRTPSEDYGMVSHPNIVGAEALSFPGYIERGGCGYGRSCPALILLARTVRSLVANFL
jgi:hypothetical protein